MARRPNYGAEKRSKELGKKGKAEEKAAKKLARKEAAAAGADSSNEAEQEGASLWPDLPHEAEENETSAA